MIKIKNFKIIYILLTLLITYCAVNILASRYYRLIEKERKLFLGLRGIDSLTAIEYLNLKSSTERAELYENFWKGKKEEERQKFEERIEYAFKQFGKYAPLSDDRIPIYLKYGPPSRREIITPQKKLAIKTKESVKPAEVWTYKAQGIIFDFIRITRAYKIISQSDFGKKVKIPHFKEVVLDTSIVIESPALLNFDVATGRFRQKKNLTRLEIYITLGFEDTTGLIISRNIEIFNVKDSLITEKQNILVPADGKRGTFYDEVNFWLAPEEYRLEIELIDIKNRKVGKKTVQVNLIDYQDDAKEIGDIVAAKLIDDAFTHEKFNKPVGRLIPFTIPVVPIHKPFYFYTEIYNLETKNGLHQLRTTYEVYNKTEMRKEIVDVMIKDWIKPGNIAYLAAVYHPMDLKPGYYIMVMRAKDLLSGKERSAVAEFELVAID